MITFVSSVMLMFMKTEHTSYSNVTIRLRVPQTLERFELWGVCGDLNLPSLPTRDPPKPSVSSSKRQRDTIVYPGSGHLVM